MEPQKIQVIYITGTGRSGSTLLETTLAQVPGVFSIGELVYLANVDVINQLCGCGQRFTACSFWNTIEYDGAIGIQNLPVEVLGDLQRKVEGNRLLFLKLCRHPAAMRDNQAKYIRMLEKLYEAIQLKSDCQIIVDSSKDIRRLSILQQLENIDLVVVHLIRDPRAVAYAWTKTRRKPEITDQVRLMDRYHPMRTAWRWLYKNLYLAATRKHYSGYVQVFYEDLADSPRQTLQTILKRVGLGKAPLNFLNESHLEMRNDVHSISGNPMRFMEGEVTIVKDEQWQKQMPLFQKMIVSGLTWPLMLLFRLQRGIRH